MDKKPKVEINGVTYPLEEPVFNLLLDISRERDYYKESLLSIKNILVERKDYENLENILFDTVH